VGDRSSISMWPIILHWKMIHWLAFNAGIYYRMFFDFFCVWKGTLHKSENHACSGPTVWQIIHTWLKISNFSSLSISQQLWQPMPSRLATVLQPCIVPFDVDMVDDLWPAGSGVAKVKKVEPFIAVQPRDGWWEFRPCLCKIHPPKCIDLCFDLA
jgi:hypothetical protein